MDILNDFLQHLNSPHSNIQFLMEIDETNRTILGVLVSKRAVKLDYSSVYTKPTHTVRNLLALSNSIWKYKVTGLRDIQAELEHLKTTFETTARGTSSDQWR